MRSHGFRTHVFYALASAAGLIASLGRTWYAPAPAAPASDSAVGEMPDTISQFFAGLSRSITQQGGAPGWQQLHSAASFLLALGVILAVCALASFVPRLQRGAASGAQLAALLALATVVLELVDQPGGRVATEARLGGWIALASVLLGLGASMQLYSAPRRRRVAATAAPAVRRFQPSAQTAVAAPPRPVWDESVPPVY
jgi:predicted anti-sigma-YlaC factor YlaD